MSVLGILAVIAGKGIYDRRKADERFLNGLKNHYGEKNFGLGEKEYRPEQYGSVSRYFTRHPAADQIDDITWNDLNMDEIFQSMDWTFSSAGEEVLYALLRQPCEDPEQIRRFEELVTFFMEHEKERIRLQLELKKLGFTGRFSLYDYLEYLDVLGERSNLRHYIADFLYLPFLVCCFFFPAVGISGLIACALWNIVSYFREKGEIDPYITSFAYIMRLLYASEKIAEKLPRELEAEAEELRGHGKKLGKFKRGAFWLMSSGRMSGSGNPLDILMDYIRMAGHPDLIKFNSMLTQVRKHVEDVDRLFFVTGYLEAAVVAGAYRKSLKEGYCVPVLKEEGCFLRAEEMYHPLLEHPVKNSLTVNRGILLTGSNASGKSTFLKTVAVSAIFAQTIHTVPAASYEGSCFHICSSMALRDDLMGGESYYIVEIRSLKRILNLAAGTKKVLCFVDEVLRGTNTVERIAASAEILKSLAYQNTGNVLCFAATHDVELTGLLENEYDNYHFEEEIADGDVRFPYKLLEGKAVTRNAIQLLRIMGYDDAIVVHAEERAEEFIRSGRWK